MKQDEDEMTAKRVTPLQGGGGWGLVFSQVEKLELNFSEYAMLEFLVRVSYFNRQQLLIDSPPFAAGLTGGDESVHRINEFTSFLRS